MSKTSFNVRDLKLGEKRVVEERKHKGIFLFFLAQPGLAHSPFISSFYFFVSHKIKNLDTILTFRACPSPATALSTPSRRWPRVLPCPSPTTSSSRASPRPSAPRGATEPARRTERSSFSTTEGSFRSSPSLPIYSPSFRPTYFFSSRAWKGGGFFPLIREISICSLPPFFPLSF